MPATDYQQTSSPSPSSPSLGFPIFSRRRDQVHSMDSTHDATGHGNELESFQKHVAERFHDLAAADSNQLLSIPWIHKLLDAFLCCQEEFGAIVSKNRGFFNRAPMDRYISEFFERNVKALDVCNAIRDGIEQIRQWKIQLGIVLCALDNQQSIGEGQFRRAKKALIDLDIAMVDEKESNSTPARRNRSFGQNNVQREHKSFGHFRSLSWSVSRSWSAARQLQAIGNNLAVPRANEISATRGLNVAVFTMNHVLLFVMWALVAAIPCQDRGLQTQFSVTRQFVWAIPVLSLHDKIMDESKKRERRNASGLLKEIHEIEKCARRMNELADSVQFPLSEEKDREVRQRVEEVGLVFRAVKDHLDPLERRVREVFHRIVRNRTECLACIGRQNSND